jgi:hypothetical protein
MRMPSVKFATDNPEGGEISKKRGALCSTWTFGDAKSPR